VVGGSEKRQSATPLLLGAATYLMAAPSAVRAAAGDGITICFHSRITVVCWIGFALHVLLLPAARLLPFAATRTTACGTAMPMPYARSSNSVVLCLAAPRFHRAAFAAVTPRLCAVAKASAYRVA